MFPETLRNILKYIQLSDIHIVDVDLFVVDLLLLICLLLFCFCVFLRASPCLPKTTSPRFTQELHHAFPKSFTEL